MIPNRTLLVLLTSTLALAAVGFSVQGAAGLASALLPAACLGFVVVVSRVLGWARAILSLLVVSALMNRYVVSIGGLNLKAEHAAIGLALVVLIWQVAVRRQRLAFGIADLLLGAWVLANGLGSINAPVPMGSLKLTFQLAILFAGYLLIQQLTRRRADLFLAHGILLVGLIVAAAFGVLVHLIYPLGVDLGMQINPITKQPTVYGTLYEGNLFGSTVMIGLMWWLGLLLFGDARFRRISMVGVTVSVAALEVSLARGAWLAVIAIVPLAALGYLIFRRRLALNLVIARRTLAALTMSVILLSSIIWVEPVALAARAWGGTQNGQTGSASGGLSGDSSSSDFIDRIGSISDGSQDQTVTQRMATLRRAAHDWTLHPIIGWGPGSYGQKYINTSNLPDWLGMLPLRVLHDTGIIGVILFTAFCVVLLRAALRALVISKDRTLRIMLVGHLVALSALFIAYVVTEGMQLFFPWLLIGLFASTIRAANISLVQDAL